MEVQMNEEEKVLTNEESVSESTEETVETISMEEVMHDNTPLITMKRLLEAGVHFGHQTRNWNPKMSKYIFGARNGIYIIDLNHSLQKLIEAYNALKAIVDENGKVLFVGLKNQSRVIIEEQAIRSGSFYVNNRWLGGTLTNFKTIQNRIRRLKELESFELDGTYERLPKKETIKLRKEKDKLSKNLEGIKEMRKLPNALVIVDPKIEHIAVAEARRLKIPVFGIADTNSDPDFLDYPIPANDDAVKSVKLIMTLLADAVVESKGGVTEIAYLKDDGEEVTMKDAIRQADKENAEKLAAIRQAQKERREKYERLQAQKEAMKLQKVREKENKEEVKEEPKKEEVKEEPKKEETPKKKTTKKKETTEKVEEEKKETKEEK